MRALQLMSIGLIYWCCSVHLQVLASPVGKADDPGAWLAQELGLAGQTLASARPSRQPVAPPAAAGENTVRQQSYTARLRGLYAQVDQSKYQEALTDSTSLVEEILGLRKEYPLDEQLTNDLAFVQNQRSVCFSGLGLPIEACLESYSAKINCAKSRYCQPRVHLLEQFNTRLSHQLDQMSPHALLKLEPNASTGQVRKAYRSYMLALHPDKNMATDTEQFLSFKRHLFTRVQEAYKKITTSSSSS